MKSAAASIQIKLKAALQSLPEVELYLSHHF